MMRAAERGPAARLRIDALRLLARRRLARPLDRVEAAERIERHGGVDTALDALAAELRASGVTRAPLPARHREHGTRSGESSAAPAHHPRRDPAARIAHVLRAASAVPLLLIALAGLARVSAAAAAHHGARWSFVIGMIALAATAFVLSGGAIRSATTLRAPAAGMASLALIAVVASLVHRIEDCALRSPLGLEVILREPALHILVAVAGGLTAAAALAGRWSARRLIS